MNNEITINPEEILLLEDGSVTDPETIRQIGLYSIAKHDNSLNCKIRKGLEFNALYPHITGPFTGGLSRTIVANRLGELHHPNMILENRSQGLEPIYEDLYKRRKFSTGIDETDKIPEGSISEYYEGFCKRLAEYRKEFNEHMKSFPIKDIKT